MRAVRIRQARVTTMYYAHDCDSHVEESELMFTDQYWDQRYLGRRPIVVRSDEAGNLSWIFDSLSFPRHVGRASATAGNPNRKDGVPTDFALLRIEAAATKGHIDTLESMDMETAAARVEQNEREEIAVQVNFPSVLLTWPIAYDPKIGCAVARAYNSYMADISGQASDRLKFVTVIDPADVEESVREIRRTRTLGSVGLMLLGTYGDRHLDHPDFEPIWRTCAELDMPVAIHPGFCNPGLDNQFNAVGDAVAIPFVLSLMLGFYSIIRSGLLDRYPNLRVGFMENGARWVDFLVMRMDEFSGLDSDRTTVFRKLADPDEALIAGSGVMRRRPYRGNVPPQEYIRRGQIYVNCEVDEHQLPFVVEEYGNDFLMFAGDIAHPHRVCHAVQILKDRPDLSEETKRKILVDNTAKFYGLPVPNLAPEPAAAGD